MLLKYSENSLENTFDGASFYLSYRLITCSFNLEKDSGTGFFL